VKTVSDKVVIYSLA